MGGPGSERAGLARLRESRAQGAARPRPRCGAGRCHRHADRSARRHGSRLQRDPRHLRRGRPAPGQSLEDAGRALHRRRRATAAASPSTRTSRRPHFVAAGVPTPRVGNHRCFRRSAAAVVLRALRGETAARRIQRRRSHRARIQAKADAAMADAAKYGNDILVEEFIEGKELTVGILDDVALPIVHIIPPDGVYDMASKYPWLCGAQGQRISLPGRSRRGNHPAVQDAALAAHRSLGVEIYSRVDVLLDSRQPPLRARSQHHSRHDGNQPAAQGRRRHWHFLSRAVQDHRRAFPQTPFELNIPQP